MVRQKQPRLDGSEAALGATAELLAQARTGNEAALTRLVGRFGPLLSQWATGRLPGHARGLVDTDDLVQVSFVRVLDKLDRFEARRPGAFLAYLRTTLLNQMRNEIRGAQRRPAGEPVAEELAASSPSPLDEAVRREENERYEAALLRLEPDQQAAVMMRLELGFKYGEIAQVLGRPSPDAARMLVSRAMRRLADHWEETPDA